MRSTVRDHRVVSFYGNQLNKARTLRTYVTWPGRDSEVTAARSFERLQECRCFGGISKVYKLCKKAK